MRLPRIAVPAICAALVLGPVVSATASEEIATDATASASTSGEIFVITFGKQSTAAAIANMAAGDEQYRAEALALTTQWKTKLAAGEDLSLGTLTAGRTQAASTKAVGALKDTLSAQPSDGPAPGQLAAMSLPKTTKKKLVTAFASGQNPNSFPVRGAASASEKSWTGLKLTVTGAYCSSGGCGPVTDRITCKLTVKPAAASVRFDSTCTYAPSSGRFGEKHFELWSTSQGAVVGNSDTSNLFADDGASGSYFLANSRSLQGSALTSAATLWVYANPIKQYVSDSAKTASATCRSDGSCRYPD